MDGNKGPSVFSGVPSTLPRIPLVIASRVGRYLMVMDTGEYGHHSLTSMDHLSMRAERVDGSNDANIRKRE